MRAACAAAVPVPVDDVADPPAEEGADIVQDEERCRNPAAELIQSSSRSRCQPCKDPGG